MCCKYFYVYVQESVVHAAICLIICLQAMYSTLTALALEASQTSANRAELRTLTLFHFPEQPAKINMRSALKAACLLLVIEIVYGSTVDKGTEYDK